MQTMWKRIKPWDFTSLYSLLYITTVRDPNVKGMLLECMKRQALHQENTTHAILSEV